MEEKVRRFRHIAVEVWYATTIRPNHIVRLGIIPTARTLTLTPPKILFQPLPSHLDRLRVLQYIDHPRPFRIARIPPRMVRPTLDTDVTSSKDLSLSRIEDQLN